MHISHSEETKKVTMILPTALIKSAMAATGTNLTETTRIALEEIARSQAYKRLLAMRGNVKFAQSWQELKDMRD